MITDYGLRKILFALAGRLIRRPRPPDRTRKKESGLDVIPPYLRKDLGLPPQEPPRMIVDLTQLQKDRLW